MAVARWMNLICGALLLFVALGFLLLLPRDIADRAREPEDLWLSAFWIGLIGFLAALSFANAWQSNGARHRRWRKLANLLALVVLTVLVMLGHDDATIVPIVALAAFGPVAALFASQEEWSAARGGTK